MAYTGFISDPYYCRSNQNETITNNWKFTKDVTVEGKATFTQTINGTAMYAQWGDLAEVYMCDENEVLLHGTLVKFGGKYEITKTKKNDRHCFGVISSKPGVILNRKETKGEKVALVGRVPVRILGKIKKFDKLTTSKVPGVAKKKTFWDVLMFRPTIGICLHTDDFLGEKLVESFVRCEK